MSDLKGKLLRDALQDYINYSIELNLQPASIKNKRNGLNRLLLFLEDRPFTLETAKLFIDQARQDGNGIASIKAKTRILRAFTNWLYRNKHIPENFGFFLVMPREHRKLKNFPSMQTTEQIILKATEIKPEDDKAVVRRQTELRLVLRFALRTGLRISEMQKLKGSDLHLFDDPPSLVVNGKGGGQQLMPLPMDMIDELKPRLTNDHLFEFTAKNAIDKLREGAQLLGVVCDELSFHSLRHIFATGIMKQGAPIQEVSRLCRHSSIKITDQTYTHYNIADLSLSLNSHNNLIRHGLDKHQIFENVKNIISKTGIGDDDRFFVKTEELTNGGLQITINPRTQQV